MQRAFHQDVGDTLWSRFERAHFGHNEAARKDAAICGVYLTQMRIPAYNACGYQSRHKRLNQGRR